MRSDTFAMAQRRYHATTPARNGGEQARAHGEQCKNRALIPLTRASMHRRPLVLALALVHCAAHQRTAPPQQAPAPPLPVFSGAVAQRGTIAELPAVVAPATAPTRVELDPSARAQWSITGDQRIDVPLRNERIRSITSTSDGQLFILLEQSPPIGAEATLVQIAPDHIETFVTRPGVLLSSNDELSLLTTHRVDEPPNVRAFDRARGFYSSGNLLRIERSTANESALLSLGGGQRGGWMIGSSSTFERTRDPAATLRFEGRALAIGVDDQLRPWVVTESEHDTIDWTRTVAERWTRSALFARSTAATGCADARCAIEHSVSEAISDRDGLLLVHQQTLGARQTRCGFSKPAPCARCRTAPMPSPVCREVFVGERSFATLEARSTASTTRIAWLPPHVQARAHIDARGTVHLATLSLPTPTSAELRYTTFVRSPNAQRRPAIPMRDPARAARVVGPNTAWDMVVAGWSASGALVRDRAALTGYRFGELFRELRVGDRFVGRGRYLDRCGYSGLVIDLRGARPADQRWTYTLALRTDALVLRAGVSLGDAAPADAYVDPAFDATEPHEYAIERTADAIITRVDQREVSRVALRIDSPVVLRLTTPPTEAMQWLHEARPAPSGCATVPPSAISWSELNWIRQ